MPTIPRSMSISTSRRTRPIWIRRAAAWTIWDVRAIDAEHECATTMATKQGDKEFLDARQGGGTMVPHRANRAVIFKSDLFHKTEE